MPAVARIDWEAARLAYLAQPPPRTFTRVARIFSVSVVAVSRRAKLDGWAQQAAEVDRKASAQTERRIIRDRAERIADTYALIDAVRSKALTGVLDGSIEARPADVAALVKIEQLLDGEATERVEVREIRTVFALLLSGAQPIMLLPDAERWPAYLALMERVAAQVRIGPGDEA
jgi:non-ribosomal peptide synthetase component E (peptide arylation enzyme)